MGFHRPYLSPVADEARAFAAEQRKSLGAVLTGVGLGFVIMLILSLIVLLSPS